MPFYLMGAEADVRRNCIRCGATVHRNTEGPHLCKDVERRLRQARATLRDEAFRWYQNEVLTELGGEA